MDVPKKKAFKINPESWTVIARIHAGIPEFAPADGLFADALHFETRCAGLPALAVAAYDGENPAGYLVAYDRYRDGSLYCWMTGVLPPYRRAGALAALMAALEDHARARGHNAIRIKTRNDKTAMLRWLVANGYMFTAIEPRSPPGDTRLHLRKEI